MRPGLIAVGEAHQNGDVESAHNHLVAAIDQGLMLGGSREFGTVEDYENFVAEVMRRRNEGRGERLEQERLVLQRLPAARLPEYEEEEVRVSREAIARVGKQGYSVPRDGRGADCGRASRRPRSPSTTGRTGSWKSSDTAATRAFTSTGDTYCRSFCASRELLRAGDTAGTCSPPECGGSFMTRC